MIITEPELLDVLTTVNAGADMTRAIIGELRIRNSHSAAIKAGIAKAKAAGRPYCRPVIDDMTVARIGRLRERGLSIRQIAARLDADGVPTARGGSHWTGSSVQRALNRAAHS